MHIHMDAMGRVQAAIFFPIDVEITTNGPICFLGQGRNSVGSKPLVFPLSL